MSFARSFNLLENHAIVCSSVATFSGGSIILARSCSFHMKLRLKINGVIATLSLLVLTSNILLLATTSSSSDKRLLKKFVSVSHISIAIINYYSSMMTISIRRSQCLKLAVTCLDGKICLCRDLLFHHRHCYSLETLTTTAAFCVQESLLFAQPRCQVALILDRDGVLPLRQVNTLA